MPRFCVGYHSNHGFARGLAQAQERLALAQCKFTSYVGRAALETKRGNGKSS